MCQFRKVSIEYVKSAPGDEDLSHENVKLDIFEHISVIFGPVLALISPVSTNILVIFGPILALSGPVPALY